MIFFDNKRKELKSMNSISYTNFQELKLDTSCIGLSLEEEHEYFCTPLGAEVIGWDNGIHYCFIQGFDETVFAVNPETCCEYYVYPIAKNFNDFLRLILATKSTNALQQIIQWNKQQYTDFVTSPDEIAYTFQTDVKNVLSVIQTNLGIVPIEHPFEYVKNLQKTFLYDQIIFSDEFYDLTGIEKP